MVVGAEVDLRMPAMEQRVPAADAHTVRMLQLDAAASTQRERQLQGEVARLAAELESALATAPQDVLSGLTITAESLRRELMQSKQETGIARQEIARLTAAGNQADELEALRQFKADMEKRDRDREATLSLERQRHEQQVKGLNDKLAEVQRELSNAKGKRR